MVVLGNQLVSRAERCAQVVAVRALSDPQALCRVLNVFAQRGIVPLYLSCRLAEPYLLVDAHLPPIAPEIEDQVLERLRALVCVDRAQFVEDISR